MKISRYILSVLLVVCFIAVAPCNALASEPIGMVLAMEGSVIAERGGANVPLAVRDAVHKSDVLKTGPGSKVQILLNDESSITLGPDTNMEMQEFADSGKDSAFAAHIGQGTMRLITGRITEANPDGFKVTTPMATVGIRGTLILFTVSDDQTRIDFQNSIKNIVVNGTSVPENNTIVVTRDGMTVMQMLRGGNAVGGSFAVSSGGSNISEDDGSQSALTSGTTDSSNIENLNTGTGTFEDVMQGSSTSLGLVTGTLSTQIGNDIANVGLFSFNVDLQSGAISAASASGYYSGNSWGIDGGTGQFSDGSFAVSGFSGTYTVGVTTHDITAASNMLGGGSYADVNDMVTGELEIYYNPVAIAQDAFGMEGQRVQ